MNSIGRLQLILHAHLPFVRHPENAVFLEENWLVEAIAECYIPLLKILDRLPPTGAPALTFSLTPTLCAMLTDQLLQDRAAARFALLVELAESEIARYSDNSPLKKIAEFYRVRWQETRDYFNANECNLLARFVEHRAAGKIEIITCAATHGLLPLMLDRCAVRRQIRVGMESYAEIFGAYPVGLWLPECAYSLEVGAELTAAGVVYTVLATHAFLHSSPRPASGVYAPAMTKEKLVVFGRDPECSRQVWSAADGYPGDPAYREFYRDLGWDGDSEYLRRFLLAPNLRHDLGFKYHRITGNNDLARKELYDPEAASQKIREQGEHFLTARRRQCEWLREKIGKEILITAPFDAELFGHWWFEGPEFIEYLLTNAAAAEIELTTPSREINREIFAPSSAQRITPPVCSWGDNGYFFTWLNGENDWIYPRLHTAQTRMNDAENASLPAVKTAFFQRLRAQMTREILLAQSSDWAFIMTTRTMSDYARRRVEEHLHNFEYLAAMFFSEVESDENFLRQCEARNNLFSAAVLERSEKLRR